MTSESEKKQLGKPVIETLTPLAHKGGEAILQTIINTLNRYIYLPDNMAVPIACWCLGTYCFDNWLLYPKLLITSPEKRCGKTTLLETLEGLVNSGFIVNSISTSAFFRLIDEYRPTLLIDESDTFLKDNEELNGAINAGHKKRTAQIVRIQRDGNAFHPRSFSVWTPMAIAGIGNQKDTIHDRSVHVEMQRRLPDFEVIKLPTFFYEETKQLRQQGLQWGMDNGNLPMVEIPNFGNDRAQDNWQPLARVAKACNRLDELLSAYKHAMFTTEAPENAGVTLLRDIQAIFTEGGYKKMQSAILVEELIRRDESPWATWRHGQPMTPNSLSRLLKPFKIQSKQLRIGSKNHRGFEAKQFENAFNRYIPPIQSATTLQPASQLGCGGFQSATENNSVALQKGLKRPSDGACSTVAVEKGGYTQKQAKTTEKGRMTT